MNKKSEEFIETMLGLLPTTVDKHRKSIEDNGGILETVIIKDVFMPSIIDLISEEKNIKLIERIFNYFEDISNCQDEHLISIFSITVLEILGNDKRTLEIAQKYMGRKTIQLQIEADRNIGRI